MWLHIKKNRLKAHMRISDLFTGETEHELIKRLDTVHKRVLRAFSYFW